MRFLTQKLEILLAYLIDEAGAFAQLLFKLVDSLGFEHEAVIQILNERVRVFMVLEVL